MAPAYTSRDEDIYVGQRQLLRQGCLGRTKLHGFVAGVEKVLRTLYDIESTGCLKKTEFYRIKHNSRFVTNIICNFQTGSPNAQFGKTQFFFRHPVYLLINQDKDKDKDKDK